ncbi:energy transducer TonB [Pseudomonas typographi]|uniref:energy transducer TonB n=1 Tax=Pseudomonas typographi TaxID=2715964 RepID=UPI001681E32D|nr:energy transducer TonB [Pseudomonas typographi]MBD1554628.1 TonB family protein [Pseudomonas typographi]
MTRLDIRLGNPSPCGGWIAETRCAAAEPLSRDRGWLIGGAVLAIHVLLLLGLLLKGAPKQLSVVSAPAAPASVRVTMVAAPAIVPAEANSPTPVAPATPAPAVMTSASAERTVVSPPPTLPAPARPQPAKPRTPPVRRPVQATPPISTEQPQDAPPAAVSAPPAEHVEPALQLPAAGPKDINTVGCRVPAPEYPRQAKRLKIEGEAVIRLVVNAQGRVDQADIAHSSGDAALDAAARQAVLGAVCTPYIENGLAVAVRALQPISFRLTR